MALLTITDLPERIHAALAGALLGEEVAGHPTGAAQMLAVAEALAERGEIDSGDLRARGLAELPATGPAAVLLRAVPCALLWPLERPALRRAAHRAAAVAAPGEGAAVTTVAAAVLCADLLRFDLQTALVRLRQTLLEEAPLALLDRLVPLPPHALLPSDADPTAALQVAITALDRADSMAAVLDEVAAHAPEPGVALSLAGALAGARQGGLDEDHPPVPAAVRAASLAAALAGRALPRLPAASGG